jgi:hypothetical protein
LRILERRARIEIFKPKYQERTEAFNFHIEEPHNFIHHLIFRVIRIRGESGWGRGGHVVCMGEDMKNMKERIC